MLLLSHKIESDHIAHYTTTTYCIIPYYIHHIHHIHHSYIHTAVTVAITNESYDKRSIRMHRHLG
jgi:hypothetical protein